MLKYEKTSDISYALGTTLIFELINKSPSLLQRIYIHPKQLENEAFFKVKSFCLEKKIPLIRNNEKIFSALANKESCMMIGEFKKEYKNLEKNSSHLVLVNPSNMGNLGTILRSSLGFGIKNVAIIKPCPDIFDPKVVRASMGAIFSLNVELFDSFEDYEKNFKENNLYPFMLKATASLSEVNFRKPFSLIFGNEATGLDDSYLNKGTPVIIKISKEIDSLNLDNAVSIGLFEATK